MGNPVTSDIHIDAALSEIAVAYKNKTFIADKVFPILPVDKQSDKYYVWDKGSWLTNQVEKRTPGDDYPEGRIKLSNDNYYADIYHLAFPIPDEDKKNQDAAVQLEQSGAEWLAHQFSMNREIAIAAAIFVGAVWDTNPTVGTDFVAWDDYANSNPITDIATYKDTVQKNTGTTPNTLVIGREVFSKLRSNPVLLDAFANVGVPILNAAQVAQALDVENLLIGEAVQRTSHEGAATATQAFIWGKHALLVYVTPKPALREPTAGYTFMWKITENLTVPIENYRDGLRDRDLLKGKQAFDFKVVGTDLGVYFASVIS